MMDLDQSDVEADARNMHDDFFSAMAYELDRESDEELRHKRYKAGPLAREGNYYAVMAVSCIDNLLLHRIVTTLCEGCLGRYGCDMCCPPDFTDYSYSREAEEDMLGRPLFPNEY